MIDLAVAFIMGAAFGKIVNSFVEDILMPPLGLLLGKVDFTNLYICLSDTAYPSLAAAKEAGAPTINYGIFINSLITFVIVSFALFLLVKAANRMKQDEQAKESVKTETKECPYCFTVISDKATRCPNCTSDLAR